jgi:hypothetical protein
MSLNIKEQKEKFLAEFRRFLSIYITKIPKAIMNKFQQISLHIAYIHQQIDK